MARVTVEDCLEKVPNRFALTVLASRRARALSEVRGTPLVPCDNKPAVTALREIAAGGVRYNEDVEETMRAYIEEQRALLRGLSGGVDHTFIDAVSFGPIGVENDDDEEETEDDVKELTSDLASLGTGGEDNGKDDDGSEAGASDTEVPVGTDGASDDDDSAEPPAGVGTEEDISDDDDDDDHPPAQ